MWKKIGFWPRNSALGIPKTTNSILSYLVRVSENWIQVFCFLLLISFLVDDDKIQEVRPSQCWKDMKKKKRKKKNQIGFLMNIQILEYNIAYNINN